MSQKQGNARAPKVEIDYEKLASEMKAQGVFERPAELTVGTRVGIAFGGLAASTCYVLSGVPVVGHAGYFLADVHKGAKMGYAARNAQLAATQEEKLRELEVGTATAPAVA